MTVGRHAPRPSIDRETRSRFPDLGLSRSPSYPVSVLPGLGLSRSRSFPVSVITRGRNVLRGTYFILVHMRHLAVQLKNLGISRPSFSDSLIPGPSVSGHTK